MEDELSEPFSNAFQEPDPYTLTYSSIIKIMKRRVAIKHFRFMATVKNSIETNEE